MNKEAMKNEAIKRLDVLNLHPDVKRDFENGRLRYSDLTKLCQESSAFGCLWPLGYMPDWADIVKKVEEENNILVYHLTHENTRFGEFLTMLYVSSYEEEWGQDFDDICNETEEGRFILGYVYNLSDPLMSEFGMVGVKESGGGLIRTA